MAEERLGHEIHLKERPVGISTESNFKPVKASVPDPNEGEFLVRNKWLSVDPYMRGRMRETKSYIPSFQLDKPLEGGCVGQVIESKNNQFKVGEYLKQFWLERILAL